MTVPTGEMDNEHAMGARKPGTAGRLTSLDALRYCMAFLVVLLHSVPGAPQDPTWVVATRMLCRAAVPYFFIVSGFFLVPYRGSGINLVMKPLRRLLPIYVFWMAVYYIYILYYPIRIWHPNIRDVVSGGEAFHLWFLPALGFSLTIVGLGIRFIGVSLTGLVCFVLATIAIVRGSYHDVIGISGSMARGGLVIAPSFVFLGFCLSRCRTSIAPATGIALVGASYTLMFLEEAMIHKVSATTQIASHDFTISTYALGASVFLCAQTAHSGRYQEILASFGVLSLGVYASHLLFLWPLLATLGNSGPFSAYLAATLAFVFSTLLILPLRNVPLVRRFIG